MKILFGFSQLFSFDLAKVVTFCLDSLRSVGRFLMVLL